MRPDRIAEVASELAAAYERHYHTCGQCTLAGILDALGVRSDDAFRSSSCFGAGVGKLGDGSCGGYLGAAMAVALLFGRSRDRFDDDPQSMELVNRAAVRLHERFLSAFGSITCAEIQSRLFGRTFDLWNTEQRAEFERAGGHSERCPAVVASAARWGTELILDELLSRGQSLRQVAEGIHGGQGPLR